MPITYVGASYNTMFSPHEVGDLLLVFARSMYYVGVPSGWTTAAAQSSQPGYERRLVVAYKFATSTNESLSGFAANAVCICLRGAQRPNPIGGAAVICSYYGSNYWQIPQITLSRDDGSSMRFGYIYQDVGGFGFSRPLGYTEIVAQNYGSLSYNPLVFRGNIANGYGFDFGVGGNWGYSLPQSAQVEVLEQRSSGFLAMF